ncbi:hypothetical protein AAC03nite_20170 [Alicyclobacillus acidoterrestris]|nr:hypothetical protein AAC03nite_20170 [Alicyclobacillus acidoterrestris]
MSGFNLEDIGKHVVEQVKEAAIQRAYPASNELRNAAMYVLRGQRNGRRYRVPNTKRTYVASKPGDPPAVRTGTLRASWFPNPVSNQNGETLVIKPSIRSNVPYNKYLDPHFGNGQPPKKVLPRPYIDRIREQAEPAIKRIYNRPYLEG